MSAILEKQDAAQRRAAKKYKIATLDELRRGPMKYRWDIIERDAIKMLNARQDVPVGSPDTFRNDFVNYMAAIYLSCCHVEKVSIPESVLHLVCRQLDQRTFGVKSNENALSGICDAQQLRQSEPEIGNKELARRIGVAPKTSRRWIQEGLLPGPA